LLVRLAFDALLDVFQAAVGRGPDGPGTLADYLSGPLGVQANDGAQQDGFCLVGGQGGDQAEGLLGGDGLDGAFLGVLAPRDEGEVLDGNQNGRRMKIGAPQVVAPLRPSRVFTMPGLARSKSSRGSPSTRPRRRRGRAAL
jgi:hypothetical protein